MARIMGEMFLRCEQAKETKNPYLLENACLGLWWATRAMQKLASGIRTGIAYDDSQCVHFSISAMNNTRMVANYIESTLGIDPFKAPGWKV